MTLGNSPIRKINPSFVISSGTQVVLSVAKEISFDREGNGNASDSKVRFRKAGSVAVVVASPADVNGQYQIEFADGTSAVAFHDELAMRRREIDDQLNELPEKLEPYIIYRCQVGSKAFGLANEDSDDDVRGIFIPPAKINWSLYKVPEQIEFCNGDRDDVFWEIEKFIRLSLKANPNVLETLWTPMVIEADELALELREYRRAFLSKHLYKTYSGYVLSQFRRMKNAFERTGKYKMKHAMHLIRLLISGIHAIRSGEILVDVGIHREELLRIRNAELSLDKVMARALQLEKEFEVCFYATTLPEQPDFKFANDFLVRARRSMIGREIL